MRRYPPYGRSLGISRRFFVSHACSRYSTPRFDEVHFGKFASYYIQRQYYFDVHPPLAKLLLGLAGWFIGYDGHFNFENIGDSYTENNVPFVGLRALPALLGSLTVPIVYAIMKETGHSTIIAAFSAILVLFGTYTQLTKRSSLLTCISIERQRTYRTIASYSA